MLRILTGLLALSVISACTDGETAALHIREAWARLPVGGSDKTAAYFQLVNDTGQNRVLTEVFSPDVRAIEMHETVEADGMLRMRRLTEVAVPSGDTVLFAPGGRHLMWFGVQGAPAAGDSASVTLHFDDGTRITTTFTFTRQPPPPGD